MTVHPWIRLVLCCGLALAAACSRPRPQTASAPVAPPSIDPSANAAGAGNSGPGNLTAQPSEFVATNKADPNCKDCVQGDTTSSPQPSGKPSGALDRETAASTLRTVDATCDILEAGVTILEKHVKEPQKAAAALQAYRKEQGAELTRVLDDARKVKAQLQAAGYGQDIPEEVRPHFEERMGKIQERLEVMRTVYRSYPDALEAFGALFPR